MILYVRRSNMTVNLSSGGTLEVKDYKLDCSDEQAIRLLAEMPNIFSRTPFLNTTAEPIVKIVRKRVASKPVWKPRSEN